MDEYLGTIKWFAFNFVPRGFMACNGQSLPISQNQALFALIGTTYGGNGTTTFNLPDFRGRVPVGMGQAPGAGTSYQAGQSGGQESVTLTRNEMPSHNHSGDTLSVSLHAADSNANQASPSGHVPARSGVSDDRHFSGVDSYTSAAPDATLSSDAIKVSGSVSPAGSGMAHDNMMPFLAGNVCICVQGIFPSRD